MAALYVHVPFQQGPRAVDTSTFASAVTREMERYARPPFTDVSFQSLYVGGDRPSRLPPSPLRTLVSAGQETLGAITIEETTLELHPADAPPHSLEALHQLGITRLSINGRSATHAEMRAEMVSRSAEEQQELLRQVQTTGFESVSVDLFFGGPDQVLSSWKTSLQRAVDLRIPHVTLHERDSNTPPQSDERANRFAFAMTFLDAKGYEQYELTHFARPGHRSRYQETVYAHGNVLGLGPGAESFWWPDRTDPSTARRWSNVTDLKAYVQRLNHDEAPVVQREELDRRALAREYILLRLRTSAGLDLDVLRDQYGVSLRDRRAATLDRLAAEGLIHDEPSRVRLTPRGRLLADAITHRLIRDT